MFSTFGPKLCSRCKRQIDDEYNWCNECRKKDRERSNKKKENRELRKQAMSLFGIRKPE